MKNDQILLSDIPEILEGLRRERFYGRVSFDLRAGEVALVRTERTQLVNNNSSELRGVNRANGTHRTESGRN